MMIKIMQGDCLEKMKLLGVESIDLTVTSPPYDKLRTYKDTCNWSFDVFKPIADELFRVTKPGGIVVWVVGDATVKGSETGSSFRQALYFKEIGFNIHDTMIWQKQTFTDTGSLRVRYGGVFEYMFIFSKGKLKSFNPIKDRVNKSINRKKSGNVRQADGSTKPISNVGRPYNEVGQRFNIWPINTEVSNTKRCHPAQFPEQLAHDHIISWSNPGDTVLDPFMGSGTTGKMAVRTDRSFVGIEQVEEYYAISKERITKAIKEKKDET